MNPKSPDPDRDHYIVVLFENNDSKWTAEPYEFQTPFQAYARVKALRAEGKRAGVNHTIGSRSSPILGPDQPIPGG